MKAELKFALPAALALTAFAAQAQSIETGYPLVTGNLGIAAAAPAQQFVAQRVSPRAEPALVQSNFEGPKASPANAASSALTRAEVLAATGNTTPWTIFTRSSAREVA